MKKEPFLPEDIHSEAFLHQMMQRQLRLSLSCAAFFLIAIFALPLLNYFFPELMARSIGGFTLSWFILGILFFPLVWCVAYFFIRRSIAFEQHAIEKVERKEPL